MSKFKQALMISVMVFLSAFVILSMVKDQMSGDLPAPDHAAQLRGYLDLLRVASGRTARGELVYLDRRERFVLDETGERPLKAAS